MFHLGLSVIKNSVNPSVLAANQEELAIQASVAACLSNESTSRRIQLEQYLIILQNSSSSTKDRILNAEILSKVVAALGICSVEGNLVIQSVSSETAAHQQQCIREGIVLLMKSLLKYLGRR